MNIPEGLKVYQANVCQGCLSRDRVLKCVENDLDILYTLVGFSEVYNSIFESPLLCWECRALLNNVKKFQARVKQAQTVFEKYLHDSKLSHLNSLSTLSTVKLEMPSHVFNYEKDEENKLLIEDYSVQISTELTTNTAKTEELETKPDDVAENIELQNIKEEKDWTDYDYNNFDDVDYSDGEIKKESLLMEIKKERKRKKTAQLTETCRKALYHRNAIKVIKQRDISKNGQELFTVEVLSLEEMEKFAEEEEVKEKEVNKKSNKKVNKRFKCKHCSKLFRMIEYLNRHRLMHHLEKIKNQLTCEECNTKCDSLSSLHTHWDVHNVMFTCAVCRQRYHSARDMEVHVTKHSKIYACVECDITLSSRFDVRRHFEMYHNSATCDYCGKTYRTKEAIANHIRRKHVSMSCTICHREFRNQGQLKRHHSACHGWQVTTSGDLAYCVECNKQFKGRKQYLAHVTQSLKHAPNKKVSLPCPECGKPFSRRSYLNNHFKLFHLKKSNHYCPDCDKYYANGDGLRKHRRSVHDKIPKEKNKICDICGRGFHTNRILINHRRTHTGERPFQCSLCPHAFAQRVALEAHRRSQHKGAPVKEVIIKRDISVPGDGMNALPILINNTLP